ncbi:MAG: TlpA disulfide reductase family protein [Mariniblastus sp.]|nr:TlpA disulfide reductase family protein [Mariniblastus sp.]
MEHLQVGHEAPDIIGKDLDGMEFRLSDYRGKVVLLDFWGHWCPPCRAMYSTEQEINQVMADKPFVLLGVNSDRNLDIAKGAVESEGLSWRHFWNGPRGTAGPISEQWNVEGWPTFYLIDAEGIIRYKQVVGEDIEIGIEKLMAELGHKVSLQEVASE